MARHIEPQQTLLPEQRSALIIRWHDLSATDRQQMLQEIDIERSPERQTCQNSRNSHNRDLNDADQKTSDGTHG